MTTSSDLASVPGIGNTLAKRLAAKGIKSRAQLKKISDELPKRTQAHLKYNVSLHTPYALAKKISDSVVKYASFPDVKGKQPELIPVGSVRRQEPFSKDYDFIVVSGTPNVLGQFTFSNDILHVVDVYASGERRWSGVVRWGRPGSYTYVDIDLFLATPEEKPFALFHLTGPKSYNIRIRAYAKNKGYTLNQYGIFSESTGRRARNSSKIHTEGDLAKFLGVTQRAPTNRK